MKETDKALASLISTIEVVLVIGIFLFIASIDGEKYKTSKPIQYLSSPTLSEVNSHARNLGLKPLDKLPWEDEQGRNIYEVRQEELATIGLAAYQVKYAEGLIN